MHECGAVHSKINSRITETDEKKFLSKVIYCSFCSISVLHKVEEMIPKSSLSPWLWIAEGLLDKNTWVWDCNVLQTSLNWFVERKLFVPCRSIWNFDRGKLVILSVFYRVSFP